MGGTGNTVRLGLKILSNPQQFVSVDTVGIRSRYTIVVGTITKHFCLFYHDLEFPAQRQYGRVAINLRLQ